MHLEAAQVAVFGPGRLHPAAASLGTQTFEVAQLSDVCSPTLDPWTHPYGLFQHDWMHITFP